MTLSETKREITPGSLEAKFLLLSTLPLDARVRRKHCVVYAFILDWWHRGYGDALASVRHISGELKARDPAGRGLYIGEIHSALSDLVEWSYLECQKGSGRRASRYKPIWSKLASVREKQNTTDDTASVLQPPNASVRKPPNSTTDSVPVFPNEDPLTRPGLQDQGTCSVGVSPVAAGVSAAAPCRFESLASAYDKKGDNLQKARATFEEINPADAELGMMIAAAKSWKRSAKGNRISLERWLSERRWRDQSEVSTSSERQGRYPSCVVTKILPRMAEDDFVGAKLWFRDRDGELRNQILDYREYGILFDACVVDTPRVEDPSEDLHEFVGSRFQIGDAGEFLPLAKPGDHAVEPPARVR